MSFGSRERGSGFRHVGVRGIAKAMCIVAPLAVHAVLSAGTAIAGNFSMAWGTGPYTWTALSLGPNDYILTDQHGFQATARFTITRNNGAGAGNFPDDLLTDGGSNTFGTQVSIWQVWNPNLSGGGIGGSTNTLVMQVLNGATALPVNGLAFNVSDIDAVDSNNSSFTSDRCDHLTFTGSNGNPALAAVTGSPVFLIGPRPGAGSSPALAANQVQCDFRVSTTDLSPSSNGDDTGTVRATYPNGTHTATVAYDESIHNVSGITSVNALPRGVGAWSGLSFSTTNSISLDKQTSATEYTAAGQSITYTYVITNTGPMTINSGQNIQIQDDKIGTFTCGTIPVAGIAPGATHSCSATYTVTAGDMTAGTVTNTAIAGVGTGTQAFADRLQSNSDAVTVTKGPTLTLVKTVTNDSGRSALPSAFTLTAAGPVTISGATGTANVTSRVVNAGTYALSETGPVGYTAGAWSCSGGSLAGANLTLAAGQTVSCTINNNDTTPTIDAVNNDFSGSPIAGLSGGSTASVYGNDLLDGAAFASTDVTSSITNNNGLTGLTINSSGALVVPAGTSAGTYAATYQICAVAYPAFCDTAVATIVVTAPSAAGNFSCTGTNLATNGGFQSPPMSTTTWELFAPTAVPGWSTNDSAIELWYSGYLGVPAHTGTQFAEMNANIGNSILTQSPSAIQPRAEILAYWAHRGRDGVDTARVLISDNGGGSSVSPNFSTGASAWSTYSLTHVSSATASSVTLQFDSISSAGGASFGNFLDTVEVCQTYLTLAKSMLSKADTDSSGTDTPGDTVQYQFAISNPAGNARSISSVSVVDDKIGTVSVASPSSGDGNGNGRLDPGETWIVTASYTLLQSDINAQSVTNVAYAQGSTGFNVIRSANDDVTVTLVHVPQLSLNKTFVFVTDAGVAGQADPGDVIAYTYQVTNAGNVPVTNVSVSDAHNGSGSFPVNPSGATLTDLAPLSDSSGTPGGTAWALLGPKDTVSFSAQYTVTQADIDTLQ